MLRLLAAMVLLLALPQAAAAQAQHCDWFDFGEPSAGLGVARVTGAGRVYFHDSINRQPSKAYVVAGDEVVTWTRSGALVCVWFKPKLGPVRPGTVGWLPAEALTALPPAPTPTPADWRGLWVRERGANEAEITIRPAANGWLALSGSATFGFERRTGMYNTVDLDHAVEVRGRVAGSQLPSSRASPGSCSIGLTRVGDWLAVVDEDCGRPNATFSGLYRREASH